ncbi:MAG: phage portal protein [Hydrogenophaga sp.]|uniref:phage portal protein n=1 Tax=Hydrogenophaga sp. TaxID=1904254 RepID=UPI004036A06C
MTTTWNEVQSRAQAPGSTVLTRWRNERESARATETAVSNEVIASSDPAVLELFGVSRAASGMAVTPESAMRVSAVYASVTRIAGVISQIPIHQYERSAAGRQQVENKPLWWMLNEEPTACFTAASMWEQVVAQMLLRESGFVYMPRNKVGDIKEMIPLPWDAVQPERDPKARRLSYYINDVRRYGADQDDMLHFPGFGFDGVRARSVIQYAARNAAGNAMAMDEYSGKFFANGAHPSIVLSTGEKTLSPKQKEDLREAFAAKYSGIDNAHRLPLVLTEGIKADTLSISAEDSQLLDARKFQVVDIARAFGVPPHLIGETSAATSWGSGLEEMTRAFMLFTIQPHLRRIEQELNRKLFRTSRHYLEFNRDAMLEGNSKAQGDFFRAALGGPGTGQGWMAADEIRRLKNLPPMGGSAAELYDASAAQSKKPTGSNA